MPVCDGCILRGRLSERGKNMDEEKITDQKDENPLNLQNEYNYVLAQQITKSLLVKGLITEAEFNKITAKNRESFSPVLAGIMPKLT
jgi:hypothetical protein